MFAGRIAWLHNKRSDCLLVFKEPGTLVSITEMLGVYLWLCSRVNYKRSQQQNIKCTCISNCENFEPAIFPRMALVQIVYLHHVLDAYLLYSRLKLNFIETEPPRTNRANTQTIQDPNT